MRRAAILIVAAALLACREPEKTVPPPPPPPDAAEKDNLLNMALGASVISRTAELTLDTSAIRAIDGDPETMWTSPPEDTNQAMVFALPAPARIEQLGAHVPPQATFAVKKMRFETSQDGKTFTIAAEPQFMASENPQLFPIAPVTASYIRITTTDAPGRFAMLQSVHARGALSATPAPQPIAGCWTVNNKKAFFVEDRGRILGAVGDVLLQGGVEGALYRMIWVRGPEWGHAVFTVSPDGQHLTGIKWHQEPIQYDFGESWFGEKCEGSVASLAQPRDISADFLQRARRLPIYGGDADLDVVLKLLSEGKRMRLVARDFHGRRQDAKLNALRDALQKRGADLSRIEFVDLGEGKPHHPIQNELMRALYGVVEIEP